MHVCRTVYWWVNLFRICAVPSSKYYLVCALMMGYHKVLQSMPLQYTIVGVEQAMTYPDTEFILLTAEAQIRVLYSFSTSVSYGFDSPGHAIAC